MNTLVVLVWLMIAPDGNAHLFVQPETTMEQCAKDGDLFKQESDAAIKTGDVKDYYGGCVPVDLSVLGKDKRGSI